MAENPVPVRIRLETPLRRLVIDWSDGVRHAYPWEYLRANCPSAGERTARERRDPLAILSKIPSSELVDVRAVGNYAISLTWADGHNVGIYSWEYLLQLGDAAEVETTAIV